MGAMFKFLVEFLILDVLSEIISCYNRSFIHLNSESFFCWDTQSHDTFHSSSHTYINVWICIRVHSSTPVMVTTTIVIIAIANTQFDISSCPSIITDFCVTVPKKPEKNLASNHVRKLNVNLPVYYLTICVSVCLHVCRWVHQQLWTRANNVLSLLPLPFNWHYQDIRPQLEIEYKVLRLSVWFCTRYTFVYFWDWTNQKCIIHSACFWLNLCREGQHLLLKIWKLRTILQMFLSLSKGS